jgi:PAS domain-containing protein
MNLTLPLLNHQMTSVCLFALFFVCSVGYTNVAAEEKVAFNAYTPACTPFNTYPPESVGSSTLFFYDFLLPKNSLLVLASFFLSLLTIVTIHLLMQRKLMQARNSAMENQRYIEELINVMPVAIAVSNPDTDECLLINEAMRKIVDLGFPYYIDGDYEKFCSVKKMVKTGHEAFEEEKEIIVGNEKKILHYHVKSVQNAKDVVQFIITQIFDVTEARLKEREASVALNRLNQFVEQNISAIAIFQPTDDEPDEVETLQYYMVNQAYCKLMHVNHEEVAGQKLTSSHYNEKILDLYRMIRTKNGKVKFNFVESSQYDFISSGFAFTTDANHSHLCVQLADETEFYFLNLMEQKAIRKLESTLMEIAVLNDQIRNPLTAILFSVEADIIENKSEFNVHINKIDKIIDTLDRRFLVIEALHKHIREKENVQTQYDMMSDSFEFYQEEV